jgi:ABC-type multidrug transport system fused ATPase/permease subunit
LRLVPTLSPTRVTERRYTFLFSICFALMFYLPMLLCSPSHAAQPSTELPPSDMRSCISETIKILGYDKPSITEIRDIASHCYSLERSQQLLNDYLIRRSTFAQQFYAGTVLMWLVVSITLSGVLFAGIQLITSYKLAVKGLGSHDASELSIEQGRIALKTSVNGLVILAISLAFFLLFVRDVYRFYEVDVDRERSAVQETKPSPTLESGGVGQPPQ